jgi:hypothetical protein
MSRKTILALSAVVFLAVAMFVGVLEHGTAPKVSNAVASPNRQMRGPANVANLTFSFPGIPIAQVVDIYEGWAKEKVTPPKDGWPAGTMHVTAPHAMTTNEALRLIEVALKEQYGIVMRRGGDGGLPAEISSPAR